MLRILKKALAKLRYRAGCHRKRSRISLFTHPALRPSLLVEIEEISTFKIKIIFLSNFLTFYSSTNPSVHHEARKVVFSAFKRLNSSLTISSHPNNQINFKIRKKAFSTFFRLFFRYFSNFTASKARNTRFHKKS